ncbi:class I adenylate-forming enzyme family protein [Roseobacter sp. S98]|uniref:class I adenylate-forming enzyme family protein n=1 Tax=Roseobacter algicola (ex Choi et al. 2025) (nom. illeg.) TaxID=3092138 RepID=UPI003F51814D
MNLAIWLAETARLDPERPALFLGRDCVATYGAFYAQSLAVAGWLRAQGVNPGDRVAIFMPNAPEYLVAFYGAWCAGAAVVPINARLHGREAAFIIADAGADVVFASAELTETLEAAGATARVITVPGDVWQEALTHTPLTAVTDRAPGDLAWLFYTSGTTGRPKGVMITFRMLLSMSLCYPLDADPVLPDDATLYAAPMSHGAGIYNIMHVRVGARHVCPVSAGFDPAEIFDLCAFFGSVQMFATPTMVQRMTRVARETGASGAGLRTVVYAGGPMYNADIIDAVDTFGPVFVQIYGQGECPMGITALSRHDVSDRQHPDWEARLQSVGRAQSGVEVMICGPHGVRAGPGVPGEIMVRGDTVMPGYWNNPEATAGAFQDGWLLTGDIGFMDAAGYITMQDRSKDMIITGGSNVYPREVEEVLQGHPDVEEVSVVGRPHAEWGEEIVAFVVGSVTRAALDQRCLERIARFKRPKEYVFVEALPKNNYGKVLKTDLRAILADAATQVQSGD